MQRLLTIMRLHTRQATLPAHMLAVDLAEVGNEEGILIACFASVMIDIIDAGFKRIADQLV